MQLNRGGKFVSARCEFFQIFTGITVFFDFAHWCIRALIHGVQINASHCCNLMYAYKTNNFGDFLPL
jgi:hypothetical protein